MKSFSTVYNNSKKEVLATRASLYESQKVQIVNVLKEAYMITGNISDMPIDVQRELATKVLEYWSPKTGINRAGLKLLTENEITLFPSSTKEDIKLYIEKQVKKHLAAITEAYRNSNVTAVTEAFKEDIEPQVKKTLKESFITNTVWGVISDRIKNGINY